jgi:hypothetical protein
MSLSCLVEEISGSSVLLSTSLQIENSSVTGGLLLRQLVSPNLKHPVHG